MPYVEVLVCWATGEILTNRLPELYRRHYCTTVYTRYINKFTPRVPGLPLNDSWLMSYFTQKKTIVSTCQKLAVQSAWNEEMRCAAR